MAGSVNKVILVGHLGNDPEVRHTTDGSRVVHLSVATSESWKDRESGERKERTEWHRVVIFNDKLGEIAEKYLQKGDAVFLEGQLQTRKWTDQNGQEKYTTEVVLSRYRGELTLLGSRRDRAASGESLGGFDQGGASRQRSVAGAESKPFGQDLNDDIPF
jgi:single-strand DNA-binding protein